MPFGEPTKRSASPADWARAAAELVAARALFASLPEAERLSVRAEAQAEAAACPPGALRIAPGHGQPSYRPHRRSPAATPARPLPVRP